MSVNQTIPNKKLTEAERAELSKKLDDELEEFMQEMAAKKKTDNVEKKPFDFDEWCKEIDQHPCFMTEESDINKCLEGKYGDTIKALQAMKYDQEENEDKLTTAERHKNEGNKHFQLKKYRWATDCYTSGIKVKCADRKLNSVLYNNRAAAQKHIGNLRTAIRDCVFGRKFDPTNLKGVVRCAECLIELGYGNQALEWIESSKRLFAFHKETEEEGNVTEGETKLLDQLVELEKKANEAAQVEERNKRKLRSEEKRDVDEKKRMLAAFKERNLNLCPRLPYDQPELMDWAFVTVSLPQLHEHQRVSFDMIGQLQWPVLIQYPEVGQVDVLTECNETTLMGDLLREVLATPPEWDKNHDYKFEKVRFFICSEFDEYLMEVFEWATFQSIFSSPGYQIRKGLPVIMVFTKTQVDKSMINEEGTNKFTAK